jgi:hypothetical protein
MKGIELPINILVIVAVAIIVLLGVIALFYSSWFTGTAPVSLEAAKSQSCNAMSRAGCNASPSDISVNYDANKDGTIDGGDTLDQLCIEYYGVIETATDFEHQCMNRVCGMQCVVNP